MTAILPSPRGPLSEQLIDVLQNDRSNPKLPRPIIDDPLDEDVQLALYTCYELHYRGFADVTADWEWNPDLLRWRAYLEVEFRRFLRSVTSGGDDVERTIDQLTLVPAEEVGMSFHMQRQGTWDQMLDLFKARSMYHLKEADPHAWSIPRLTGQAKAAFVAVEFDEYGGGRGERMHSVLFGDLMEAAGLSRDYLYYLDDVPGQALSNVNFMSMCGLHRGLRGAMVGLFTAGEIVNAPSSRRMVEALTRLGAPSECIRFYAEHVEADAMHEQVMRNDVLRDLIEREPELRRDVVFGVESAGYLESRLATHLIERWESTAAA
ncbi:iron-containing redox enzyme family protein [Smaragdicoccus niigatensis]|uniref:iron-containing redox enzyme family protein n=1 Tax=Smaragdicoccus niigatensis TaxID=359359 RepID=UPI000361DD6A|nr:iron-containing redox enzyme family protein [Smaragdicoccus niigatensis]